MASRDITEHFVVDSESPIGFGWCTRVAQGRALVRYVDLPDTVVDERWIPVSRLTAVDLPDEMRIWVRNKVLGWWPGPTRGRLPGGDYAVKTDGVTPLVRLPPW